GSAWRAKGDELADVEARAPSRFALGLALGNCPWAGCGIALWCLVRSPGLLDVLDTLVRLPRRSHCQHVLLPEARLLACAYPLFRARRPFLRRRGLHPPTVAGLKQHQGPAIWMAAPSGLRRIRVEDIRCARWAHLWSWAGRCRSVATVRRVPGRCF